MSERVRHGTASILAALLIVLSVLASAPVSSDDVTGLQEPLPRFRSGLANLGEVAGGAPLDNSTLWEVETVGPVLSAPVVAEDRGYGGTMDGELLCLNAFTGREIWSVDLGMAIESTPAVSEGRVYVGSDSGDLTCLDAIDGTIIWNATTDGEIKSSPAVVGDRVYVGSNDFDMHCFDVADGTEIWAFSTGGYVYSSPAVVYDRIYFGSCDGNMYALNATTGEKVWNFHSAYCPAAPAVTEDLVIFGAYDRMVHYLNRTTGEEVLNVTRTVSDIYSSPGVYTAKYVPYQELPIVFIADNSGMVIAINETGEVFWNRTHEGGITSSPIISSIGPSPFDDPFIVYGDQAGVLHGLRIDIPPWLWETGDPIRWDIKLGSSIQSSPFLYHERVYVGVEREGGKGAVVCIGSPTPDGEVWIEVLEVPEIREGIIDILVEVYGVPAEDLAVEILYEGTTEQATYDEVNQYWYASTEADPPEDWQRVDVLARVDGIVVALETVFTMVLIEGWDSLDIAIERPKEGSHVDGLFRVEVTAHSNYTIQSLVVRWDEQEDHWNILDSGEFQDGSWNITIDTRGLEDGEHVLWVLGHDGYREGGASITLRVGEEGQATPVKLSDIAFVIFFVLLLVYFVRTKPARVSEDPSKR
ncbi:MAG: PQQ-binding-like beta-propeller repeat protein [Thermoplasmata archaeon]|nr:PQQ-binding-like beta-propeller repeat protein [Thermoplasmata archaeon]